MENTDLIGNKSLDEKKEHLIGFYPIVEQNFRHFKLLFTSRTESEIKNFAENGIRMYVVIHAKTKLQNMAQVLNDLNRRNINTDVLKNIKESSELANDRLCIEIPTDVHVMQLLQEYNQVSEMLKNLEKELQKKTSFSNPTVNVNFGSNSEFRGVPEQCMDCGAAKPLIDELNRENKIIKEMKEEMGIMRAEFMGMMGRAYPDKCYEKDFDNMKKIFTELPSELELDVWFAQLKAAKDIDEFNRILENTEELSRYKGIDPSELQEKVLNSGMKLHEITSNFSLLHSIYSHKNSAGGSKFTKEEKTILKSLSAKMSVCIQEFNRSIKENEI